MALFGVAVAAAAAGDDGTRGPVARGSGVAGEDNAWLWLRVRRFGVAGDPSPVWADGRVAGRGEGWAARNASRRVSNFARISAGALLRVFTIH